MARSQLLAFTACYLTLTNVVFEFFSLVDFLDVNIYLTLTNVVFEYWHFVHILVLHLHLTLTNVVFELSPKILPIIKEPVFNFNKCCI